jgi:cysteinyl-tRNA synthetase
MKLFPRILLAAILSLAGVAHADSSPASFAYILQADSFASNKPAAAERLAACGRDWLVLDPAFGNNQPWTRADLDAIRHARPGRKIIAYLSIGEAEDYRSYWRKEWAIGGKLTTAAPAWLGAENPEWKGNYRVKYWRADWQKLALVALDDAMASGFDGVYLDIVDGFETFEQNGGDFIDNRVNPETEQSYRRDMVDWVKIIAARARERNPKALVIPQNGSQLLAHKDFLNVISAIGIEDLFTDGDKPQPKLHTREVLGNLKVMAGAKKPVLVIEYPTAAKREEASRKLAHENGLIWLVTDRQLKTLGESGN